MLNICNLNSPVFDVSAAYSEMVLALGCEQCYYNIHWTVVASAAYSEVVDSSLMVVLASVLVVLVSDAAVYCRSAASEQNPYFALIVVRCLEWVSDWPAESAGSADSWKKDIFFSPGGEQVI